LSEKTELTASLARLQGKVNEAIERLSALNATKKSLEESVAGIKAARLEALTKGELPEADAVLSSRAADIDVIQTVIIGEESTLQALNQEREGLDAKLSEPTGSLPGSSARRR
jgi:predicted nuclease with TOPRIM domain